MSKQFTVLFTLIAILAFLVVGCSDDDKTTAPTETVGLKAQAVSTAPTVDGTIDAAWSTATAYTVTVGSSASQSNAFGAIPVMLKAVTNNNRVYVLAQWTDPSTTESISKKQWSFANGVWSKASVDEDRFFVMFDVGNNGTEGANCATMCHQPTAGFMGTTGGGNVDVWHWKAARTNPAGKVDDKWWDSTGRGSDAKVSSLYTDNVQLVGLVEYPMFMHSNLTTAYTGDFLYSGDAAAFDSTLNWTGSSIPYYTIDSTATGSRWDVSAKGVYANGIWTLEMSRALNTGNADDVVLGTGSVSITIAVTDNSGGDHSGSTPFNLIF